MGFLIILETKKGTVLKTYLISTRQLCYTTTEVLDLY